MIDNNQHMSNKHFKYPDCDLEITIQSERNQNILKNDMIPVQEIY